MSEFFAPECVEQQPSGHPHDLLSRLYREIGISAVAAALDAMARPAAAASVEPLDAHRISAVPRSDDIAA
ncbi:MAG: hypothetical protein HYZ60_04080 [Methylocystis sp.]|nr:hypothetical protein [Methylocystis sp.]